MALSVYPTTSRQTLLSDGTTLAYAYTPPSAPGKPTFLLLHGFPSNGHGWHRQVTFLAEKGFGVLVPDLLGYGDTDSPAEYQAYSHKRICDHVAEIIGNEGIKNGVIGVGHDL